ERARMSKGKPCAQPGCKGKIGPDDYCDTCGMKAAPAAATPAKSHARPAEKRSATSPGSSVGTLVSGSARARGSRRTTSAPTRTTSRRTGIGAGLVEVPPAPVIDPSAVVLKDPSVTEDKRF